MLPLRAVPRPGASQSPPRIHSISACMSTTDDWSPYQSLKNAALRINLFCAFVFPRVQLGTKQSEPYPMEHSSRAGFLSLSTADIWGGISLSCRGRAMHRSIFSPVPGLSLRDARCSPLPTVTIQSVSRHCPRSDTDLIENHRPRAAEGRLLQITLGAH